MKSLTQLGTRAAATAWRLLRPPRQPRDCILCYHSIHPRLPYRTRTPDEFRKEIEWLTSNFEVVSIADLLQPRKSDSTRTRLAISFDDGYADNYEHAFPVLLEFGIRATFFVTTGYIDRDPVVFARFQHLRRLSAENLEPLTWLQLHEMSQAGMEIGCHTLSHPSLLHIDRQDAEYELTRSKERIEEQLQRPVLGMAYPFGKPGCTYGTREVQIAVELGFEYAVTTINRDVRPGDDRWQLPRLSMGNRFPSDEQVEGLWDCRGVYNQHAPLWLARWMSPRGFQASTYGGSYADLKSHTQQPENARPRT